MPFFYTEADLMGFLGVALVSSNAAEDTKKADKVIGAVNGNLATLDASGNLVDSGLKPENIVGIFDDTNIYVNLVNGVDTNLGTEDNPFLTIEKAFSLANPLHATIYIIGNTSTTVASLDILGSYNTKNIILISLNQEVITFNSIILRKHNTDTRTVLLKNIAIQNLISYTNTTLMDCKLFGIVEYYGGDVEIKYQRVNHANSTHNFKYGNPSLPSKWSEDATCEGSILSLPNVLEDVIRQSIIAPDHATLTKGDRFLIGVGATGEWLGKDQQIATWNLTDWDYQPLIEGNIVSTQEIIKKSFIYQSGLWSEVKLWLLSTRTADSISPGLMSTNDYEKLLYSSTTTKIKISNNLPEERLVFNPVSTYYEFTSQLKFSKILIDPELNDELITSVDNAYPTNPLVRGNIVVTLPDPRTSLVKSSFAYDGDVFKVQLNTNPLNIDNIIVKAPNGLIISQNGIDINGNIGVIISQNTEMVFKWDDNNPDPNYRTKLARYEIL